jgi:hypothetical protein
MVLWFFALFSLLKRKQITLKIVEFSRKIQMELVLRLQLMMMMLLLNLSMVIRDAMNANKDVIRQIRVHGRHTLCRQELVIEEIVHNEYEVDVDDLCVATML